MPAIIKLTYHLSASVINLLRTEQRNCKGMLILETTERRHALEDIRINLSLVIHGKRLHNEQYHYYILSSIRDNIITVFTRLEAGASIY